MTTRVGRWLSWVPWTYNPYTGIESPGRESAKHLVVEETETGYAFLCGKSREYDGIADEWTMPPPSSDTDPRLLRRYCVRCARKHGVEIPKDHSRDHQRQRVYRSEWAVRRALGGIELTDLDESQAYADAVMDEPWFRLLFPGADGAPVNVRARRGSARSAHADSTEIALGAKMLDEYTILHELAHTVHKRLKTLLMTDRPDVPDHSGHGRVYVGILLRLVDEAMGDDAGRLLREAFRGRKVRWTEWEEIRPKEG